MGHVQKRGDKWQARYRGPDGKERTKRFTRKVDAEAWLVTNGADILSGSWVDPKAGKTTVRAYAAEWEIAQVGRPATLALTDNALRVHILPAIGDLQMAAVRPTEVQRMVKVLSAKYAPGTVRNIASVAARLFESAVDDRVIPISPYRKVTLPKADDDEVVPPTVDEVVRVMGEMPGRLRAAVVLLAGSGLRIGELLGLKVSDVDFLRRSVRVERQRLQSGVVGPAKTNKSARTVPLGDVVIEALAGHLKRYPTGEWLFILEDGSPVMYPDWQKAWRPARTRAGTAMHTHDFRHFYASALISGGASVKQVQMVLGHQNAMVTLRTYSHLFPGDEDRTRAVIDGALDVLRTTGGQARPGRSVLPGRAT